jgi:hypothetical protein
VRYRIGGTPTRDVILSTNALRERAAKPRLPALKEPTSVR